MKEAAALTEQDSKFSFLFVTEAAKKQAIKSNFELRWNAYKQMRKQWKKDVEEVKQKYQSAIEAEEVQHLITLPQEPKFHLLCSPSEMKTLIIETAARVKEEIQSQLKSKTAIN